MNALAGKGSRGLYKRIDLANESFTLRSNDLIRHT